MPHDCCRPDHVLPGDVVYLNLLGRDTVVLGSLKAAHDLLDKRSANYSDRPTSVMVQLYVDLLCRPQCVGWLLVLTHLSDRRLESNMTGSQP